MPKFLQPLDMNRLQILGLRIENRASAPSSPQLGDIYVNTGTNTLQAYNGSSWVVLGRLDQLSAPTGDVSLNSQKITNLATPAAGADAATKAYVDGVVTGGVSWKNPVRVAATGNVAIATDLENGDTVDGVVLATGDRVLLPAQSTASQNGIYDVPASGAASRSSDADTGSELVGATVFVSEGTANGNKAFSCTTDAPITLGTTSLTFVQISGLGQVTAGGGIGKSGDTLSVAAGTGLTQDADGLSLTVPVTVPSGGTGATTLTDHGVLVGSGVDAVDALAVGATGTVLRGSTGADPAFGAVALTTDVTGTLPIANGGTGGATAAAARIALAAVETAGFTIGDGAATTISCVHNFGTRDVIVQVYQAGTPWAQVFPDIRATDTDTVDIVFASAPATNAYRVVIAAVNAS